MRLSLLNESLLPVGDYFRTVRKREVLFEWGAPFVLSLIAYFLLFAEIESTLLQKVNAVVINFTAILVGFSVASLSILASSSSDAIDRLKKHDTERTIGGSSICLYRLLLINFIYLLFMEFTLVILGILYLLSENAMDSTWRGMSYLVIVFLFLHSIALNFRNLSSFYFVFTAEAGDSNKEETEPTHTKQSTD